MNHQYQTLARPTPRHTANHQINRSRSTHASSPVRRFLAISGDASAIVDGSAASDTEGDTTLQDDPLHVLLKERFSQAEDKIADLFRPGLSTSGLSDDGVSTSNPVDSAIAPPPTDASAPLKPTVTRKIDDDYGDDDDDEEDEARQNETPEEPSHIEQSPLIAKVKPHINGMAPQMLRSPSQTQSLRILTTRTSSSAGQNKDVADVRKELEEHKTAAERRAKRSFHTAFFTFESDRHAMLEQQKLDELDRQMENEMTNSQAQGPANANGVKPQGSLSSADLGASSLTLKHLIARIDAQRNRVKANDTQLRSLISEVRKGRSKWASEDKVGQEELYEAAEKVLMELKAMTEYSTPFLQRVNKRDAPDYYHIIKYPMDMGTMIKKLKSLQYKSKKDFVNDLNAIWANCLLYNGEPTHPIRRKALHMRKETDKLVPLIPDITIRDRAEVEAEEERNNALENGLDGGEDSEDDLPIMASRGRKAPSKGKPGEKPARKDQTDGTDATSDPSKPTVQTSASGLRNEFLRADSDAGDATSHGLSTPPPAGLVTPQTNGLHTDISMTDAIDVDAASSAMPQQEDVDENDAEFITWRQVTKKDRATVAADRNRLFQDDRLNPEEPALLRSKAGMRRWLRQQKQYGGDEYTYITQQATEDVDNPSGDTLAEGIEQEEDRTLPDYYDTLTAIPNLDRKLGWLEDHEAHIVPHNEQYMRMFPAKQFTAPVSTLSKRVEANMRQMQNTRKICAKIGVVKQMQIQAQFQKYEPEPFAEKDIEALAVSEDGPVMSPWVCRAALQRSVGSVFYHAGFEDFHPSALEAMTDVASNFLNKLVTSLTTYMQAPRTAQAAKSKFTAEEEVLHCLHENGIDLDTLETYVTDDVDRLGSKLVQVHDRLRSYLADLLRPALGEGVGADGEGAFNDGSEQFVGGDFAEDIDEDFFGFRELGLADELGLQGMSVPLHLLQNRVHNAYAAGQQNVSGPAGLAFPPPESYSPVTTDFLPAQLGLIQEYFASKLAAANGRPLIEDQDLPPKQRFPKPRLGPSGKISSPRKRPLREQQQIAKKKRKMEESNNANGTGGPGSTNNNTTAGAAGNASNTDSTSAAQHGSLVNGSFDLKSVRPMPPLKLDMPLSSTTNRDAGATAAGKDTTKGLLGATLSTDPEKVDMDGTRPGGPIPSPEGIAAN